LYSSYSFDRKVGAGRSKAAAANSGRERRPIPAQTVQPQAGRIDQTHAIADLAPISALQLLHQRRKQASEHFERARQVGRGERRLRNRAPSEVIKLVRMALQARLDLAKPSRTTKLPVQHRDQMRLGLEAARIRLGTMLLHKPIENRPRNMLQKSMKNDILVPHGVAPCSRPVDSQTSGTE